MELFQNEIIEHWLSYTIELAQRFSIIVVIAFALIQREWLRKALMEAKLKWQQRLITMFVFGGIAVVGTLSGVVVDLHDLGQSAPHLSNLSSGLQDSEAIVGFRDTMTMMAGLIGGTWVGLGAGLIAGIHRYSLGGFAGLASGLGTVVIGLFAGSAQHFFPRKTATTRGVLLVALIGTALQRIVILLINSSNDANALSVEIAVPVVIINCTGCVLFYWIMSDLDRARVQSKAREAILIADQAKIENERLDLLARAAQYNANFYKQQAELRALHAQVEPHFLNNTLGAIQALISVNPDNARSYIAKLATFFNETRESSVLTAITLEQELMQVQHYMEFQQLRFLKKVVFEINVSADILDYQLPPRSLQTLVENALTHGRRGINHPLSIVISSKENSSCVILQVQDNGCGIAPERLALLGKQNVLSKSNGTALYQLNQTLALGFSDLAKLEIHSTLGQGTTVTVKFPKEIASC